MNRMIVAIGGTGQNILLHYLQLYLIGVIDEPFQAVVVDTDEIFPAIVTIANFFGTLQYGRDRNAALGVTLPTIATMQPTTAAGETLTEVLTGNRKLEETEDHPVRAFFGTDTLAQGLMRGLFARPATSAVLSRGTLKNPAMRPTAGSTVVFVGSVIGGTGGGLIVPLMESLYSYQVSDGIDNVKLRGVFFGQYFTPSSGLLAGDSQRFRSNQVYVLKSIREAAPMLHSFHIVGGAGTGVERDPEKEKSGASPWPRNEAHPVWEGLQALEFLLSESAKEKSVAFEGREFATLGRQPELERSRLRLSQALQVARVFIQRETVHRIFKENWLDMVWGPGLTDLIAHFGRIAIHSEGRDEVLKQFPNQLQRSLGDLWRGQGNVQGLAEIFPSPDEQGRVRPGQIRKISWPRVQQAGSQDPQLFSGQGKAAERLAASLLFWILRKGGLT